MYTKLKTITEQMLHFIITTLQYSQYIKQINHVSNMSRCVMSYKLIGTSMNAMLRH